MAYYEKKVEYYGSSLVLFQRNLAVAVPKRIAYILVYTLKNSWTKRPSKTQQEIQKVTVFSENIVFQCQQIIRINPKLDKPTFKKRWKDSYERYLRNKKYGILIISMGIFKYYLIKVDCIPIMIWRILSLNIQGYQNILGAKNNLRNFKVTIRGLSLIHI